MTAGTIAIAALIVTLVFFLFARQLTQRPVTQRELMIPLALGLALGVLFMSNHPQWRVGTAAVIGVVFGVFTGLLSGQLIRVWRDEATGVVLKRGGWRYLGVIIALLLIRVLIRVILTWTGSSVDELILNAGLLATLLGNVVGRDIVVALRVAPLLKGGWAALPGRYHEFR